MRPAMITKLTMVVMADANFGPSRFRSEPFLRRFPVFFHNFQKKKLGQKRLRNSFSVRNAYIET